MLVFRPKVGRVVYASRLHSYNLYYYNHIEMSHHEPKMKADDLMIIT